MLPVSLFIVIMALCGVFPFGDRSLLLWDAEGQYISFLAAWRRVLLGQADPFYTLSRTLGGSMVGLVSYYLASPINVLLALFPETEMPNAFACIVLLKIGLCGLSSMAYFGLGRQMGPKARLFSTTYALMGFVACYFWDIMWLDGIVLLPLIAWGIEDIVSRKQSFRYLISLAMALWSNYYIGYMLCLFSALYFVYVCALEKGRVRFWAAAMRFAGASLLAGGLAAVMLVPAFYALRQGYSVFSLQELSMARRFPMIELATKLFTGAVDYGQVRTSGLPAMYVGIPVLALAFSFFLNSAIPLKKRVCAAGFVLIFLISFQNDALYSLWHGFESPNGMPARFSFIFSFLLCGLAAFAFQKIHEMERHVFARRMVALAGAFFVGCCILFQSLPTYLASETVCFDVACFLLSCVLIVALRAAGRRRRAFAFAGLCALQAACLVANGYFSIHRLEEVDGFRMSAYRQELAEKQPLFERLTQADGVYRIETNDARNENDALQYGYAGLSHYSSDVQENLAGFFSKMGQRQLYMRFDNANGLTPVAESLLGVRFLLWREGASLAQTPYAGYRPLWREGEIVAYENPYALPIAVMVPEKQTQDPLASENPFINQNALLSDWLGYEVKALELAEIKEQARQGDMLHVRFSTTDDAAFYFHSSGTWFSLNGSGMENHERFAGCVMLPQAEAEVEMDIFVGDTQETFFHLAVVNDEVFEQAMHTLAKHACEVRSEADSVFHLNATADAEHSQLLLTLPYDAGWKVWVDGEAQDTTMRYHTLLAVNLPEGSHEITLRFVPYGLQMGGMISLLAFVLGMGWWLVLNRKERARVKKG